MSQQESNGGKFDGEVHECPTCGKNDFKTDNGMKQHHTLVHGESITGVEVECDYCGDEVERKNESQVGEKNFCNQGCCGKYKSNNYVGEDHHLHDESTRVEVTCDWCGGIKTVYQSEVSDSGRMFCDNDCRGYWMSANAVGEDGRNYQGGIDGSAFYSSIVRNLGDNYWIDIAKDQVENSACEKCGSNEDLHAHHIVPVKYGGVHHKDNLMSLCPSCHRTVESYIKDVLEICFVP